MAKNDFDQLMSVGVDIGKDVFHLVGFNKEGQLVLRKKIKRKALAATFEELPHCSVGMEACMSAHFVSKSEASCQRLLTILGIGPIISTAVVAAVGTYDHGRDFAAWLGLVPHQHSTSSRTILGRVTKRGSRYLREVGGCGDTDAAQQTWCRACHQTRADRMERSELRQRL